MRNPMKHLTGPFLALALLPLAACGEAGSGQQIVEGGDAAMGAVAMANYGCGTCHTVPGIAGADAMVGPPLDNYSRRVYVAGVLPNQPEELIRWIRAPREVDPRTAMPDLGVTEEHARDIAAYLYAETGDIP